MILPIFFLPSSRTLALSSISLILSHVEIQGRPHFRSVTVRYHFGFKSPPIVSDIHKVAGKDSLHKTGNVYSIIALYDIAFGECSKAGAPVLVAFAFIMHSLFPYAKRRLSGYAIYLAGMRKTRIVYFHSGHLLFMFKPKLTILIDDFLTFSPYKAYMSLAI